MSLLSSANGSTSPIGLKTIKRLLEKSLLVNTPLKKQYTLFAKSGFSDSLEGEGAACFSGL